MTRKQPVKTLTWYCQHPDYFMLTAHRGASHEFPENTLLSMEKAIGAGADMIEFDVTCTKDGIPVILHDTTIDRTSDGKGGPGDFTLDELKEFNFSYWLQGERRQTPAYGDVTLPTFVEMLDSFHDRTNMNIQLHDDFVNVEMIRKVCSLFVKYAMFDHAYLTVNPDQADVVMEYNPDIELCVTPPMPERSLPKNILACKEKYHCRFIQPVREYTGQAEFALMRDLGLRGNVFYTDDIEEMRRLRRLGATGVMTNKIHLLAQSSINEDVEKESLFP